MRAAAARLLVRGLPAPRRAAPQPARAAPRRSRATSAAASVSELVVTAFRPERGGGPLSVRLAYATHGDPRSPCILHPTSFDAKHPDLEYAIGPGRTLDSDCYFVVVPNMLGNGVSSSPSNTAALRPFPLFTVADNVRLQARLFRSSCLTRLPCANALARCQRALLERLGVSRLALCYGYSMGAQQALHWAAAHPSAVERVLASCGTASCQPYNALFLEALLAVLGPEGSLTAPGVAPETRRAALAAFGRVYAGWGLPAEWYRRKLWARHGYASLDDFVTRSWEAWTCAAQPDDLRAMLRTWRAANIGGRDDGAGGIDVEAEAAALGRITARCVYMPGAGDRYFPIEEVVAEAALVGARTGGRTPRAEVVPLSAEWGHRAGDPYRPGQEADAALMRDTVARLLAAPAGGA
jgi:homoserine O-acetyltransferase